MTYLVTWTAKGPREIATIRALRRALGLGLSEAVEFQSNVQLPFVLLDGADLDTANSVKERLTQADSTVDVAESQTEQPMIFYRPDLMRRDTSYSDIKSPIMRAIYRLLDTRRP